MGNSIGIREWRKNFLNERGLRSPNGEYLYTYKMTKAEFIELERSLVNWLRKKLRFKNVSKLVNSERIFNELFVLYAAEWWKRKYRGGHWTWRHILDDLAIDPNGWSPVKRSECVSEGFKAWRISISDEAGKRYLGSIAIQGGLPINLMAHNRGSVSRVLHRVIDLMANNVVDHDLIVSWIRNLSNYLPKTYQNDAIYDLLAEVIIVISNIKNSSSTNKPENIISEWKTNKDKWKERFPISFAGLKTIDIIENLVTKVAKVKPTRHKNFISFNRLFDFYGREDERLQVKITFERTVEEEVLKKAFEIDDYVDLDSQLVLKVQSDDKMREVQIRKLIGENEYKFDEKVIDGFSGRSATNEIKFLLRDKRGNEWVKNIEGGEKLDEDQPWIFVSEENNDEYAYLGQGSKKVSGRSFLIVVKDGFEINTGDEATDRQNKIFEEYDVFKLHSNSHFINNNGEEFRVRNKYTGGRDGKISMDGNEITNLFISPTRAFRGVPKLTEHRMNNSDKIKDGLQWKIGRKRASKNELIGPVTAVKKDSVYTQWKKKMVVLPRNSHEKIIHEHNAQSGWWRFDNWGIDIIEPLIDNISVEQREESLWHFTYTGKGAAPEKFYADLIWKGNATPAKVSLQFPNQGVRAFNGKGEEISTGELCSLNKLHGIRVNVVPGDCKDVKLELKTNHDSELISIRFKKDEHKKELRLIDYKEVVDKMSSLSKNLDDSVKFKIYFDGRTVFKLNIARYSFELNKQNNQWYVPGEILNKLFSENDGIDLNIQAQRLDVPGVQDYNVSLRESGLLKLPGQANRSGPWIMYPSKNSDLMMKPVNIRGDELNNSYLEAGSLKEGLSEPDRDKRLNLIDTFLEKLVNNPAHEDWANIARLANEFGHLPLSTLDIWKRAIYNFDFIAMLAVGKVNVPKGFVDRFSRELPFMFEFIPFGSWQKAIYNEGKKIIKSFSGNELYNVIKQKNTISDWNFEAFKYGYLIALNECVGVYDKSIKHGKLKTVNLLLYSNSPQSSHQKLRQRHLDDEKYKWPSNQGIYNMIKKYSETDDRCYYLNERFRTVVVNTPIMLAHWFFQENVPEQAKNPSFIHTIRKIKDFDEMWFTNAFNLTLLKLYYLEQ